MSKIKKPKTKRHKFHAIPTTIDGIRFASKAEARRYEELKLMQKSKEIKKLELQPSYQIEVNGQKICKYIADFRYQDSKGNEHIEDVKGILTPVFRLKQKLLRACHGLEIEIVK